MPHPYYFFWLGYVAFFCAFVIILIYVRCDGGPQVDVLIYKSNKISLQNYRKITPANVEICHYISVGRKLTVHF